MVCALAEKPEAFRGGISILAVTQTKHARQCDLPGVAQRRFSSSPPSGPILRGMEPPSGVRVFTHSGVEVNPALQNKKQRKQALASLPGRFQFPQQGRVVAQRINAEAQVPEMSPQATLVPITRTQVHAAIGA